MKNSILTGITLLTLILLTCQTSLFSQDPGLAALETEFSNLEKALQVLNDERGKLAERIQSNGDIIQQLKSEKDLNYFQRQNLEDLLRESQVLSLQIESVDAKTAEVEKSYLDTGQKLIDSYDSEIRTVLDRLETAGIPAADRQTHLARVEMIKAKRAQTKLKLTRDNQIEFNVSKVEIEPEDPPRQIKLKADLLKDQEEKFRKIATQSRAQVDELQQELQLRTRINDLVTDMAVFDQQEEGLTGILNETGSESRVLGAVEDAAETGSRQGLLSSEIPVGQKDFDLSNLSVDQIEEVIEQLQDRNKKAEATADSLGKRAEIFYKKALEPENK